MEKRVHVYHTNGGYAAIVKLDTDDIGNTIGEVYSDDAAKLGAIRYEPLRYQAEESLVYNNEGEQIGYLRLERSEDNRLEGNIYRIRTGADDEVIGHVRFDSASSQNAEVLRTAERDEVLGTLKPENVSNEELILVGGGAAILAFMATGSSA